MSDRYRDYVTECESGEDIAGFFVTFNTENWMSTLRYYAEQAGWDSRVGCRHERGAFNDRARAAHAERGIEIPATFFCFDCGEVREVPVEVAEGQGFRTIDCDTQVRLGGIDADGNHHDPEPLNLSPARPDYVTADGVEVWIVRKGKGPKARFVDASGNQVGAAQNHLAGAVVYARYHGWTDPTNPEWFEDAARREVLEWDGRKLVESP